MVSTKVKFRAAVRRAKGEANSARAHNLLVAAEGGDRTLLQEMRKVLGSKHQEQELPDSMEGAVWRSSEVCTQLCTTLLEQRTDWRSSKL